MSADLDAVIAKQAEKRLAEVGIEWPLGDGHKIRVIVTRQLTKAEYKKVFQLLRLAKEGLVRPEVEEENNASERDSV